MSAFLLMASLWLVQRATGNAAVVDVGWTLSLALLHWQRLGQGWAPRSWGLALLVTIWSLRLGSHLFFTRVWGGHPEEGRYQKLREEWGSSFQLKIFCFFQAQALSAVALTAPFAAVYGNAQPGFSLWEPLGAALSWLGMAGEGVADRQLADFKRERGQGVCQRGLWRYSRHPNYFFEVVTWTGWAVYASGSPGGGWAFLSAAAILLTIVRFTGIPPTEAQALRSKGEAYAEYQRRVSPLIPWFRRD